MPGLSRARFSKGLVTVRARRQILIVAQFLAHKPLNFALFTDSFIEELLLCCLQTVYSCEVTSEAGSMLCRSAP